jgi:hypothetical protein
VHTGYGAHTGSATNHQHQQPHQLVRPMLSLKYSLLPTRKRPLSPRKPPQPH